MKRRKRNDHRPHLLHRPVRHWQPVRVGGAARVRVTWRASALAGAIPAAPPSRTVERTGQSDTNYQLTTIKKGKAEAEASYVTQNAMRYKTRVVKECYRHIWRQEPRSITRRSQGRGVPVVVTLTPFVNGGVMTRPHCPAEGNDTFSIT